MSVGMVKYPLLQTNYSTVNIYFKIIFISTSALFNKNNSQISAYIKINYLFDNIF